MKVHQLISLLADHDPELEVVIPDNDRLGWVDLIDARRIEVAPGVGHGRYTESGGTPLNYTPVAVIALD